MKPLHIFTFLLPVFFFVAETEAQQLNYHKDSLGGRRFSVKDFDEHLYAHLEDSAVGWSYCIWQNGKSIFQRESGYAIAPVDTKDSIGFPFKGTTRMHIASLSKTITALAIAKLVDLKKLDWDTEAKAFLPSYWQLHPLFEHLTVRQLITMKSGLDGPLDKFSSGIDSLHVLIERGPNPDKIGIFNYQNTSYGLLRIIIAYASGYKEFSFNNERAASAAISNIYKDFVNNYILKPAGIDSADCSIIDHQPAMSYPFPYHNEHGDMSGDYDLCEYAGGLGWYLSTKDAAKLINAVFYSQKIVSVGSLKELFAGGFPFAIRQGKYASYFGSGGDWGHPLKPSGWQGIHTFFYCFPDNVVAVVFTNSGEGSPSAKILRAYWESFK